VDPNDVGNECIYCLPNRCISTESDVVCSLRDLIWSSYDCPADPMPGNEYSDAMARSTYLPLIAAAYSDTPQTCLTNQNLDFVLQGMVQVKCDDDALVEDHCRAFWAVSTSMKTVVVSFRGTDTTWEGIQEALSSTNPSKPFVGGGKVFPYFYDAFFRLWNGGLQGNVTNLKTQYPDYKLLSVGHSLGAAMASVFSTFIATQGPWQSNEISYVGFGQPRTGDQEYAIAHDAKVKYSYHIVHHRDLYAHLPPPNFGGNSFSHHRFEVWYNNDMTPGRQFQVCPRPDDLSCSNGQWDFNAHDHQFYFDKELGPWAAAGCPMS